MNTPFAFEPDVGHQNVVALFHVAPDSPAARVAAERIVADWQQRLAKVPEPSEPHEVFRSRRPAPEPTRFSGFPEMEIQEEERRLGIRFPTLFRAYLREMGYESGALLQGSDLAGLHDLDDFRAEAEALMTQHAPGLCLPQDAVVFMHHQGYAFFFLRSSASFDAPVFCYLEGGTEFQEAAPSLQALVEGDLDAIPHRASSSPLEASP